MSKESLKQSIKRRLTIFYSRSRKKLWLKGETSGNFQHIVSITADCDYDALTIQVIKDGVACHLGTESCFNNLLFLNSKYDKDSEDYILDEQESESENNSIIDDLYTLLLDRKSNYKEGSYTCYLFNKGTDKILKKVGEETTEVVVAVKNNDRDEAIFEISDLTYHVLTLMAYEGITPGDIREKLASRGVVEKKVKQERMQ